jgi:hypothetical protein
MPVEYKPKYFETRNPYAERLDRLALLNRAAVDFIPIGRKAITMDTNPLIETDDIFWERRYSHAARIMLTNPICYTATRILQDTMSDAPLVVQERQSTGKWKNHDANELALFLEHPNPSMDNEELNVAYTTHMHTFGCIYIIMFQKGDILPNGLRCEVNNQFEPIYPQRFLVQTEGMTRRYYFLPIGREEWIEVKKENVFMDVFYNPIAHGIGVSLPSNPLRKIFEIHELYFQQIRSFFTKGAKADYVLSRRYDFSKEDIPDMPDEVVEEAVRRVSSQSLRTGVQDMIGLAGDWNINKIGSMLPELINKDLLHQIEILVKGVYGVPASIFWAGLAESNQRASRQQDSIDFYQDKIHRFQKRIANRLGDFLIPKVLPKARKFRLYYDVSEMPLAQYSVTKDYRMYERWWIRGVIKRGRFLEKVNEPTDDYTQEELEEYYASGNAGMGATGAEGDSVEAGNGLE